MNLELQIDELILDGFPAVDRSEITAVIEREVARLLAENGASEGWGNSRHQVELDGGTFEIKSGASAEQIGTQVAQAIVEGIST